MCLVLVCVFFFMYVGCVAVCTYMHICMCRDSLVHMCVFVCVCSLTRACVYVCCGLAPRFLKLFPLPFRHLVSLLRVCISLAKLLLDFCRREAGRELFRGRNREREATLDGRRGRRTCFVKSCSLVVPLCHGLLLWSLPVGLDPRMEVDAEPESPVLTWALGCMVAVSGHTSVIGGVWVGGQGFMLGPWAVCDHVHRSH